MSSELEHCPNCGEWGLVDREDDQFYCEQCQEEFRIKTEKQYSWYDWVYNKCCPYCDSEDVDGFGDGPNAPLDCNNCEEVVYP